MFIETLSSYLDVYGITLKTLKIGLIKVEALNFKYILNLILENIKYIFFLLSISLFIKYKKKILNLHKKLYKITYLLLIVIIFILIISFKNFISLKQYYFAFKNKIENNLILRNDNWFLITKLSLNTLNNKLTSQEIEDFNIEKLIKNKKNIYIFINESYPNFKDKNLYDNLFNKIIDNSDVKFSIYKREYSKEYTTLATEEFILCNKFDDSFLKITLNEYLVKNNCWSENLNYHKIYIHSYRKDFFNRYQKYKSYFNETLFYEELKNKGIKDCPWNDVGSCDYDVLDNLNNLVDINSKNKFILFLTLNNHLGLINKTYDKELFNCSENHTLNINSDFCLLYNNQLKFNISVNKFLKNMTKNDILIMLSDTPPMFNRKLRKYFKEKTNIYVFEK